MCSRVVMCIIFAQAVRNKSNFHKKTRDIAKGSHLITECSFTIEISA